MNRVTDTCIPEDVVGRVEERLLVLWESATSRGERKYPFEFIYELLIVAPLIFAYLLDL